MTQIFLFLLSRIAILLQMMAPASPDGLQVIMYLGWWYRWPYDRTRFEHIRFPWHRGTFVMSLSAISDSLAMQRSSNKASTYVVDAYIADRVLGHLGGGQMKGLDWGRNVIAY